MQLGGFTPSLGSVRSLEPNRPGAPDLDAVAKRACSAFGPPCGGASILNSSKGIYFLCTKTTLGSPSKGFGAASTDLQASYSFHSECLSLPLLFFVETKGEEREGEGGEVVGA